MTDPSEFDILLVTAPGLETALAAEAKELGLPSPSLVPGGVQTRATWPMIWQAHLNLRGAARILVRIAEFRAMHPAQLDKRSRKVDWAAFIAPGTKIRVEATSRKSRIYHAGAAASRVTKAIVDLAGAEEVKEAAKAALVIKVRLDDDLCTISLDATGDALHKRGHKPAVGKAPMRENMAALFLRQCGFTGDEPVLDPMCGSGTFVIEAAEIAAKMQAGRSRGFAFENLVGFDADKFAVMRDTEGLVEPSHRFYGFDRDAGAVKSSTANAEMAGVQDWTGFGQQAIGALTAPDGPVGLVIVNPPYGARIGNRKLLFSLYATLGARLKSEFSGWRVGLVTSDGGLAKATGLPWVPNDVPVAHGGIKVNLWRTKPLP